MSIGSAHGSSKDDARGGTALAARAARLAGAVARSAGHDGDSLGGMVVHLLTFPNGGSRRTVCAGLLGASVPAA